LKPRSLRVRLLAWYAAVVLAGCAALGVYTYEVTRHYLLTSHLSTLFKRAQRLDQLLLADIDKLGEDVVANETRIRFSPEADDRFIRITRPDGTVLYQSGIPISESFDPSRIALPSGPVTKPVWRKEEVSPQFRLLVLTVPYAVNGRTYLVEMGSSLTSRDEILRGLFFSLCLGLPVVVAGAVLAGHLLIGKALAPVSGAIQASREITLHQLDKRLPLAKTGDEIEELIVALNDMIDRLDHSFRHASRFSADASHELRTPLTILRGELEAALQGDGIDGEARAKIASILEETERLAKVVEGLFAVSRLEAGEAVMEVSRFDLAHLVFSTAEQMELLAEEKQIALAWEADGCIEIEGDRFRLKQVAVNLIDNAIKYTPRGGEVRLSVRRENGRALFQVADTGPGIDLESLPHIFDRFFRSDAARFAERGGAGLGLSIVRTICMAHGGSVVATNREPRGSLFTVDLPLPVRAHSYTLQPSEA
jgi:heavy metal sensor kinase